MWKAVFLVFAAVSVVLSGFMPGGLSNVDLNDNGARSALNFAVVQHNRGSNSLYLSQAVEVKIQRQVVSGIKYIITANMTRSLCKKANPQEVCGFQFPLQPYQCTFSVWSRPWLNEMKMLNQTCLPPNNPPKQDGTFPKNEPQKV